MSGRRTKRPASRVRSVIIVLGLVILFLTPTVAGKLVRRISFWRTGSVELNGLTFYLQPGDTYLTEYVLDWGSYEPTQTKLFRSTIKPGDTFVDVGANIGWYTVIACKLVGETGRVIAFEPDPTSFGFLARNVEANACGNVTLEQKALSNAEGTVELFIATEHLGLHRIYDLGDDRESVSVDAVPLDSYLEGLDESSVNVIKIDTEGAEGVILEGMTQTVEDNRGLKVFLEYDPHNLRQAGYDPSELFRRSQNQGFEFHAISEGQERVFPVSTEAALLEAQADDPSILNFYLERPPS